jgi:hypothetical protein
MLPILRALKDRLLNEPAFFLAAASAGTSFAATQFELPGFIAPLVVVLGGVATRAVVKPA